ncbi:MFS transporter [Metallosphaera sp.]|uniref:MFS transporter n=1 Tax=unclassified Metallosphaera TaxID=2633810 RepID=UPI003161AC72
MESKSLRTLIFTSLAHFSNDGVFLVFPLLIVYYTTDERISVVFLGALAIVYTLLSGLLSPLIGDVADKRDSDAELIALGIFLEALATGLFALSFLDRGLAIPLITLGVVLLGSGQAFYHPLGGAILARIFGKSSGRALGINGAMGSLGRAVMPSIITFLILGLGEVLGLGIFTVYMVLVTLVIYFGLMNVRRGSTSLVRKATEKLDRRFYRFLIILGALVFMRSMFISGTTTFLGEFVYQVYFSKAFTGIFLTVGFLGSVFGQPVFGWLTERLGGRTTFLLSSVLSLVFFGLFLVFPRNLFISLSSYTLFTFAAFTGFPILLGYIGQVFPKNFFTVANSYVWGIGNTVGGAAGTALVTWLLDLHYDLIFSFTVLFVIAVISTVLTPLIPKKI